MVYWKITRIVVKLGFFFCFCYSIFVVGTSWRLHLHQPKFVSQITSCIGNYCCLILQSVMCKLYWKLHWPQNLLTLFIMKWIVKGIHAITLACLNSPCKWSTFEFLLITRCTFTLSSKNNLFVVPLKALILSKMMLVK
jgi:hypothetical protein